MLIFETHRLAVRPYLADDAEFVLDMYSRWEVVRFLGPAPKPLETMDEARGAIERWRAMSDSDPLLGHWAVTLRSSGELVGTVVMQMAPLSSETKPLPLSQDYEVGWHLHPQHWGRGYATEATRGALDRTFDAGIPEVIALMHPDNERSRRVAERVPMEYMGRTQRYYSAEANLYCATRPPRYAPEAHQAPPQGPSTGRSVRPWMMDVDRRTKP